MKNKAPKKLAQLKQIDGKSEPETSEEAKFEKVHLSQVWGDTGEDKYGTLDESVYAARLEEMNLLDLQNHAVQDVGITAVDNRGVLVKRLMAEFNEHAGSYRRPVKKSNPQKLSNKALNVLAEGR